MGWCKVLLCTGDGGRTKLVLSCDGNLRLICEAERRCFDVSDALRTCLRYCVAVMFNLHMRSRQRIKSALRCTKGTS